jgi:hypothetical protein
MAATLHRNIENKEGKESDNMDRWVHSTIVIMYNSYFTVVDDGTMVPTDNE